MNTGAKLFKAGKIRRVILLGSGGLSIGQAGEFDYSGSQALRALVAEGIEVLLVNPNIATIQTNPDPLYKVFLYPIEPLWVEKVILAERPDAIIAGFGGQTALNCVLELEKLGILSKHGVVNLGTSTETLRLTEDRDLFAGRMREIGLPVLPSVAASTVENALSAAGTIGYPVIVRAAFALGGLGSGFANNDSELQSLVGKALASAPQVLVEKSLQGWKELEYEVMRDREDNAITICNMENVDPLGIHTGDSIVVAPSQTLGDCEYQMLRNAALKIVRSLKVVGECNVQFALSPSSLEFYVIEVNARLSRSSALASKATGYPIALIAAKVVLGYSLLELKNPVTGNTSAFHEPSMDYVILKIPRWDMDKFQGASRQLGPAMKSVGEVMAIGRNFREAFQKAVRSVTDRPAGLSARRAPSERGSDAWLADRAALSESLSRPTDLRMFALMDAFRAGFKLDEIAALTSIDPWFLSELQTIANSELEIREVAESRRDPAWPKPLKSKRRKIEPELNGDPTPEQLVDRVYGLLPAATWLRWKRDGFSDYQIASLALPRSLRHTVSRGAAKVRELRTALGVKPCLKGIDTTGGEHPCESNYLYLSYQGSANDLAPSGPRSGKKAMILGGGPYRVGSSVEFDWCAVECSRELRRLGWRTVIVNCNPETVSTDFASSDQLYFEELSLERILDIVELEAPDGVITSLGGQLPNSLAESLAATGVPLIGHSAESVGRSEDRESFSTLLDLIGVEQPRWVAGKSAAAIEAFVSEVGYPLLVRPSYVLSGSAMNVAHSKVDLDIYLRGAAAVSDEYPVVVSEFLLNAREVELDGIARRGSLVASVVSEHVENAGVHSGDATIAVPTITLDDDTLARVKSVGASIAKNLGLNGPFNVQFLIRDRNIKVIECNARASRSFPFVSKVTGLNLACIAARVFAEVPVSEVAASQDSVLKRVGVKAPMFSFSRLAGVDPLLGVEMLSTGEVACVADSLDLAFLLALQSAGVRRPKHGILISSGSMADKEEIFRSFPLILLFEVPIFATPGTADYLSSRGVAVTRVGWSDTLGARDAGRGPVLESALQVIARRQVDFVVNIPKDHTALELAHCTEIRKAASAHGCTILTDARKAILYIRSYHSASSKIGALVPAPL